MRSSRPTRVLVAALLAVGLAPALTSSATAGALPPDVDIVHPTNLATVPAGPVTIAANAASPVGLTITKVVFAVDGTEIATDTTAPYDAVWQASAGPGGGPRILSATAYDSDGEFSDNTIEVNVGPAGTPAPLSVSVPAAGECRVSYSVDSAGLAPGTFTNVEVMPSDGVLEDDNVLFYPRAEQKTVTLTAHAYNGVDLVASSAPASILMTPCRPTVTQTPGSSVVPRVFTATASLSYGNLDLSTLDPSAWTAEWWINGFRVATDATAPYAASINLSKLTGAYSLVARAVNQHGVATALSPTSRIVVDSATTLTVSKTSVARGAWGRATGTLTAVNSGAALPNQRVQVFRSIAGAPYTAVAYRTTNGAGQVFFDAVHNTSARYIMKYAGVATAGLRASQGAGEVGARLPSRATLNKTWFRAPGSAVLTGFAGLPSAQPMRFELSRDGGRTWGSLGQVTTLANGTRQLTLNWSQRGTYYYRVARPADLQFAYSPSSAVRLVVG